MKTYLCPQQRTIAVFVKYFAKRTLFLSIFAILAVSTYAQELQFNNHSLISGTDGADGAVYRFPAVNSSHDIDALVTINGRSSSQVKLIDIDVTGIGHTKAFQPKVTYGNNSSPSGISDWWMEFQISFVRTGTNTIVPVDSFDLTAIDIDGNGDKINEWVSMYNCKSYKLELNSLLSLGNITDIINSLLTTVGKQFMGPVKNFTDIDTSATTVMATSHYEYTNSFRIRTGAHSTGQSGAADRLYSFWFKSFDYQTPTESTLPLLLERFDATLNGSKVDLSWTTSQEREVSHFTIERSTNGVDYKEVGLVFATDNAALHTDYDFKDPINTIASGVLYYRLRMVDTDGKYQYSPVRLIRVGGDAAQVKLLTYPNPVTAELRVTLPNAWQSKEVVFEIFSAGGQLVKHIVNNRAGQTEVINMQDMHAGIYLVKVSNGNASAVQRIVKTK
jgi:hypothetical protein